MPPMGSLTVHGFNRHVLHIYILPFILRPPPHSKPPVNPTHPHRHSLQFFWVPFSSFFADGLNGHPCSRLLPNPHPQIRHAKFHPLFACNECVISKPMHACPLTPTAYTSSSLVFRPLHFDVTPSAECVLTVPLTPVFCTYRQLVHPMHHHPSLVLFFCTNIIGPFQGPVTDKALCGCQWPREKVLHG